MEAVDVQKKDKYFNSFMESFYLDDSSNIFTFRFPSANSTGGISSEEMIRHEVERQLIPIRQTQNVIINSTAELYLEIDSIKEEISNISDIYTQNYQLQKKVDNLNKLNSFKNFEPNWNGYKADSFNVELIDRVWNIINLPSLKFQPDIFPTARQSIQFEYEKSNGNYLEFEIFQNRITGFSIIADEETEFKNLSESEMLRMIDDFYPKL